ncbi:MAG: Smr/MutS family protein [Desulfovibrionaceae bacterium]
MDLPKKLLNKHLPKATAGQKNEARQRASASGQHIESETALSDDALFRQAMQGMIKAPCSPKVSTKQGAFPVGDISPISVDIPSCPVVSPQETVLPVLPVVPMVPMVEEHDFALAMRSVKPLKGKGRDIIPEVETVDASAAQGKALQDMLDGEIIFDVQISGETIQGHVVGLDEKSIQALVCGAHSPEARLDLHGMNALQAFQALVPFFRTAWHKGLRTVIVVTGRGVNSPTGIAVLRHKVHSWLTQEPFKRVVMAFSTARPSDGGAGSIYVLLRKYRKKHKVYWERSPADFDLFV